MNLRELAERIEHEDDAMARAEIAMEMASAYLKDQAERQQPIDAEWLRGLGFIEVHRMGSPLALTLDADPDSELVVEAGFTHRGFNDVELWHRDVGRMYAVGPSAMKTRGQLLDLLAGLRGDESARGTP